LAEVKAQLQAQRNTADHVDVPTLQSVDYDEAAYAAKLAKFTEQKALEAVQKFNESQNQNTQRNQESERLEKAFENHQKRAVEFEKSTPDYQQSVDRLASVVQFTPRACTGARHVR